MRHPIKKTAAKTATNECLRRYKWLTLGFLTLAMYMLVMGHAFAYAFLDVLCNMGSVAQGNFFRGIATLAIIAVGVGATMGKVSWTMAVTVAVGISIITSAGYLTALIAPTYACLNVN